MVSHNLPAYLMFLLLCLGNALTPDFHDCCCSINYKLFIEHDTSGDLDLHPQPWSLIPGCRVNHFSSPVQITWLP